MVKGRLIRGPPPSPAQSTDGDPASEAPSESCAIFHPVYLNNGNFGASGLRAAAEGNVNSFEERGAMYAPTSEYTHGLALTRTMLPNSLQANTPPASEDNAVLGSLDSRPRWSSPSSQKHTIGKTRVARSPKVRRRPRKGKDREVRPQLSGPLSELTKHMTHVPIKDMEVWVHRSVSARHQEVAKKNGKVARPMNSFMLYRSAYADRTKEWFSQSNHQVVSEAAGDSWKLEPREVREKYELLANIEKHNHLKAHPGYKFTPAKDKKKRPGFEDDHSLLEEHENTSESSPALLNSHTFSSSEVDSNGWESNHSTPFDLMEHGLPIEGYVGSSWPTSNPGRPASGIITSEPSQYFHSSSNHGIMGFTSDETNFKKFDSQEFPYMSSTTLAGLPGAAHHDLLQPQTQLPTTDSCANGQLDPQLLENGSQVYGSSHYSMWQESPASNCYLPVTATLAHANSTHFGGSTYQSGMPLFVHGRETWDSNQDLDGSGGEFDHWINNQPSAY